MNLKEATYNFYTEINEGDLKQYSMTFQVSITLSATTFDCKQSSLNGKNSKHYDF